MELDANFTTREVASSANSYAIVTMIFMALY